MSKLNYLLTCESVIVGENNAYTLVNIFNLLNAPGLPFKPKNFTVAFSVEVDQKTLNKGMAKIDVDVVNMKTKKPFFGVIGKARRKEDASDNTLKSEINFSEIGDGIVFDQKGVYSVRLLIDGKVIGEKTFTVN